MIEKELFQMDRIGCDLSETKKNMRKKRITEEIIKIEQSLKNKIFFNFCSVFIFFEKNVYYL